MQFTKHSGIYTLYTEQLLEASIEEVWSFFSNPENLNSLSPTEIGFAITSPLQKNMYRGQIITYKIALFPLVKLNWVTEITQVEPQQFFIDEQRFGPYKMWHHEHIFTSTENGVLMIDKISFKMPYGPLGRFAYFLFVKRKLTAIFKYRAEMTLGVFKRKYH